MAKYLAYSAIERYGNGSITLPISHIKLKARHIGQCRISMSNDIEPGIRIGISELVDLNRLRLGIGTGVIAGLSYPCFR